MPVTFLDSDEDPEAFAGKAWTARHEFGPFSLLVGDRRGLWFVSSHGDGAMPVVPGVHALSNHLLDTPWPKVSRIRDRLRGVAGADPGIGGLLDSLFDTEPAADEDLPDTGLDRETERLLSAPFVRSPEYGTRSSTVLVMGPRVRVAERGYDTQARVRGEIAWEFAAC